MNLNRAQSNLVYDVARRMGIPNADQASLGSVCSMLLMRSAVPEQPPLSSHAAMLATSAQEKEEAAAAASVAASMAAAVQAPTSAPSFAPSTTAAGAAAAAQQRRAAAAFVAPTWPLASVGGAPRVHPSATTEQAGPQAVASPHSSASGGGGGGSGGVAPPPPLQSHYAALPLPHTATTPGAVQTHLYSAQQVYGALPGPHQAHAGATRSGSLSAGGLTYTDVGRRDGYAHAQPSGATATAPAASGGAQARGQQRERRRRGAVYVGQDMAYPPLPRQRDHDDDGDDDYYEDGLRGRARTGGHARARRPHAALAPQAEWAPASVPDGGDGQNGGARAIGHHDVGGGAGSAEADGPYADADDGVYVGDGRGLLYGRYDERADVNEMRVRSEHPSSLGHRRMPPSPGGTHSYRGASVQPTRPRRDAGDADDLALYDADDAYSNDVWDDYHGEHEDDGGAGAAHNAYGMPVGARFGGVPYLSRPAHPRAHENSDTTVRGRRGSLLAS